MFRFTTLAIAGLAGLVMAPAVHAADWSGCYAGVNGGYASANTHLRETSVNNNPIDFDRGSQVDRGWAFGAQAGCDTLFNQDWLVGFRGLWDKSDLSGSVLVGPGDYVESTDHTRINSFATLVGKLGVLVAPTVQAYAIGGLAWADVDYYGTVPVDQRVFSGHQNRLGYDVGAGLSVMVAPNWELWGEYDYMNFGTGNVAFNGEGYNTGVQLGVDSAQDVHKVLIGINYRFDQPSP
ncbi:MAG TPA: outer membrane beta-barrel protein [Devosiaceae bacterium]